MGNNSDGSGNESAGLSSKRGIGLRVTNIDDNLKLPRRGMFSTSDASILDGLEKISKSVENPFAKPVMVNTLAKGTSNIQAEDGQIPQGQVKQADISYASKLKSSKPTKPVNFRILKSEEVLEDVDIVLPRETVRMSQDKYANTLYGYFLGKRLAFPVVEYFARKNWVKFGLQKSMMNSNGFFFFKFSDEKGMKEVLEGGPWLIKNTPFLLNAWSPTTILKKDDIKKVAVWVKIHNVPLAAYSDDGLSMLATKLGTPKMLDSYTAQMCSDAWGRSSFARALIELSAEEEIKEDLKIAIPMVDGEGYVKETMKVEYEWRPPRCETCKVFGHQFSECPKNVKIVKDTVEEKDADGFIVNKGKNNKKKGIIINKPKQNFIYRPIEKKPSNNSSGEASSSSVPTSNPFSILDKAGDGLNKPVNVISNSCQVTRTEEILDDEENIETVYDETALFMEAGVKPNSEGASTPGFVSLDG
ncbi:uncharacterized protein LOC110907006 [Helianthus annuus]|uniref:uncharacterized protein LOC110907006 n=1 Tax=Helianthus annuus TaxID=4232 RepID=UPI000B8F17F0|nr:uncharacterized protein LOC110907006 [Helianthus annuus]